MATPRKGSLQRIQSFQKTIENHTKDSEFTPATHTGLSSGFLWCIPHPTPGEIELRSQWLWPIPVLRGGKHIPRNSLFFFFSLISLAQQTQSSPTETTLSADQEGLRTVELESLQTLLTLKRSSRGHQSWVERSRTPAP